MTRRFLFAIALILTIFAAASAEDGSDPPPAPQVDHGDHDHDAADDHDADADGHDHDADGHDHDADDHDDLNGEHEDAHDHEDHRVVRLSQAELVEFGIAVAAAGSGIIETTMELPGEVQPNADRLAHIVPRYSGIVTEVRAHIGDYVKKGQVLAIVESDQSLAPFEMKTLISGTVIEKHITLGEAASRDRNAFVIADLSSVWIDLTVYQRDLNQVKRGQNVQVFVGHDLASDSGNISYITPIVDERTRTATARLVLPNKSQFWRPGMFVTGSVLVERAEVPLAVPRTALHTFEENTVVFLETDEGFQPRIVSLGRHGKTHAEVLSGLSPGDRYVSAGGFTLKAELGKGAFGDGHGH